MVQPNSFEISHVFGRSLKGFTLLPCSVKAILERIQLFCAAGLIASSLSGRASMPGLCHPKFIDKVFRVDYRPRTRSTLTGTPSTCNANTMSRLICPQLVQGGVSNTMTLTTFQVLPGCPFVIVALIPSMRTPSKGPGYAKTWASWPWVCFAELPKWEKPSPR
ncbi:hypothetical protein BDN72DRAFT_836246 [Pluteus cervinus]|uniref:Uncharacterized protein n=1 Tax=Pluteus cervinus TaxID=181527 RepID=A0ACD3B382_9AGAR|nr:hypothetical protein BDN72DRAFT_836246 [Pluteus cervinus]